MAEIEPEAVEAARALVGGKVALRRIMRGRNSRVYRTTTADAQFALKVYPPIGPDGHDRFETETRALALMADAGIQVVPRIISSSNDFRSVLMTWIEGVPVTSITKDDLEAAIRFLADIDRLRLSAAAARQSHAAEACLSGADIVGQIELRRSRLGDCLTDKGLVAFLTRSFDPTFVSVVERARSLANVSGIDFEQPLSQSHQTLAPSDFGFHNAVRRPDGNLAFFDFDYFGWDDPVKLIADLVLHPGHALTERDRQVLTARLTAVYGNDPALSARLAAFLPLFGLRWALILLNDFVRERWRSKPRTRLSWEEAKAVQLAAARRFLAGLARIEAEVASG